MASEPSGNATPRWVAAITLVVASVAVPARANEWDEGPNAADSQSDNPARNQALGDFGKVEAPASGAIGTTTDFQWKTQVLRPNRHRLNYTIDEAARQFVDSEYRGLLDSFFQPVSMPRSIRLPEDAYVPAMRGSMLALEPLVQRFSERAQQAGLDAVETADMLASFVQTIPYEIPSEFMLDLRPPALILSQNAGDCDSKSLLFVYLARRLGLNAQILLSEAHGHAVASVAVPARGVIKSFEGVNYALIEATAEVPIGFMAPQNMRPDDWRFVPLEWPTPGIAPTAPEPGGGEVAGAVQVFTGDSPCGACGAVTGWLSSRGVPYQVSPASATKRKAWLEGRTPGPPVIEWGGNILYAPNSTELEALMQRLLQEGKQP